MNLLTFLEKHTHHDFFNSKPVFCFYGSTEYPVLFFASLFDTLKRTNSSLFESIDLAQEDVVDVMARLQMSFLGSSVSYWLRDIAQLDDKSKKKLVAFMRSYTGPNKIIFFSSDLLEGNNIQSIEVPDVVDKKIFTQLLEKIDNGTVQKNVQLVTALFSKVETITLDRAYAFMRYITLIGASKASVIDNWLNTIMVPERSLFTLSQYFFAKDARQFFSAWSQHVHDYSEAFWITFWSEQIWRTHSFVRLMHEKKFSEAKAIAYRLPFSLIQRDWKKLSLDELQSVHHALYQLDYSLKNGGSGDALELVYTKFMSGAFNSKNY